MEHAAEYEAILNNRENLYRFLGRIYKVEADAQLLTEIQAMGFPDEGDATELGEGYRLLERYLRTAGPEALTDLAVDYARVFLGAGIIEQEAAYPYESVYTSPKKLIMQDARDEVLQVYRENGVEVRAGFGDPEDHVALEFEFMACLCRKARQLLARDEQADFAQVLQEQQAFLQAHLLNWVPSFCEDISRYAQTSFYQAAAKITQAYLQMEADILALLLAETLPAE